MKTEEEINKEKQDLEILKKVQKMQNEIRELKNALLSQRTAMRGLLIHLCDTDPDYASEVFTNLLNEYGFYKKLHEEDDGYHEDI